MSCVRGKVWGTEYNLWDILYRKYVLLADDLCEHDVYEGGEMDMYRNMLYEVYKVNSDSSYQILYV